MFNIEPVKPHLLIPIDLTMHRMVVDDAYATDAINESLRELIYNTHLADYEINYNEEQFAKNRVISITLAMHNSIKTNHCAIEIVKEQLSDWMECDLVEDYELREHNIKIVLSSQDPEEGELFC